MNRSWDSLAEVTARQRAREIFSGEIAGSQEDAPAGVSPRTIAFFRRGRVRLEQGRHGAAMFCGKARILGKNTSGCFRPEVGAEKDGERKDQESAFLLRLRTGRGTPALWRSIWK